MEKNNKGSKNLITISLRIFVPVTILLIVITYTNFFHKFLYWLKIPGFFIMGIIKNNIHDYKLYELLFYNLIFYYSIVLILVFVYKRLMVQSKG